MAKEPEYGPEVFWYYPAYGGTFWYPRERGMLTLATDQISDEEFKYLYESLSDSFGIVEVVPGLMMVDTSSPETPMEDWELKRD